MRDFDAARWSRFIRHPRVTRSPIIHKTAFDAQRELIRSPTLILLVVLLMIQVRSVHRQGIYIDSNAKSLMSVDGSALDRRESTPSQQRLRSDRSDPLNQIVGCCYNLGVLVRVRVGSWLHSGIHFIISRTGLDCLADTRLQTHQVSLALTASQGPLDVNQLCLSCPFSW